MEAKREFYWRCTDRVECNWSQIHEPGSPIEGALNSKRCPICNKRAIEAEYIHKEKKL